MMRAMSIVEMYNVSGGVECSPSYLLAPNDCCITQGFSKSMVRLFTKDGTINVTCSDGRSPSFEFPWNYSATCLPNASIEICCIPKSDKHWCVGVVDYIKLT